MKIKLGMLAAFLCAGVSHAEGDRPFAKEWDTYRTFLTEPACGVATDIKKCEQVLTRWGTDFRWATDPSWNAQYRGQRNLSICLYTGCNGEVTANPSLACAWAKVVLLSGHPQINNEDLSFEQKACGGLPSPRAQQTAEAQAARLLKMLGIQ